MGYWKEKKDYEEGIKSKNSYCICGRLLTDKNIKGKCTVCEEELCKYCGKVINNKIFCKECSKEELEVKEKKYLCKKLNINEKIVERYERAKLLMWTGIIISFLGILTWPFLIIGIPLTIIFYIKKSHIEAKYPKIRKVV